MVKINMSLLSEFLEKTFAPMLETCHSSEFEAERQRCFFIKKKATAKPWLNNLE